MRRDSALPNPNEIMMAVPEEAALRQIEIEALRGILDNLRRLNDGQAETMRTLHQMDARLIRQEVQNEQIAELKREMATLKDKTDSLESDRDKRHGAVGLVEWLAKYWPALAFAIASVFFLLSSGKLSA